MRHVSRIGMAIRRVCWWWFWICKCIKCIKWLMKLKKVVVSFSVREVLNVADVGIVEPRVRSARGSPRGRRIKTKLSSFGLTSDLIGG